MKKKELRMKNKIRTIGLVALAMSQKTFVAHHLRIIANDKHCASRFLAQ
jgi:hypothetical protein